MPVVLYFPLHHVVLEVFFLLVTDLFKSGVKGIITFLFHQKLIQLKFKIPKAALICAYFQFRKICSNLKVTLSANEKFLKIFFLVYYLCYIICLRKGSSCTMCYIPDTLGREGHYIYTQAY